MTTTKVIVDVAFPNTDPGSIPATTRLQGVLSVAGAQALGGGEPSGYVYQGPFQLKNDGNVQYVPQVWLCGSLQFLEDIATGSTNSAIAYYSYIAAGSNGAITLKAFIYRTFTQWENNSPDIITRTFTSGDDLLFTGKITVSGRVVKFFQAGVESSQAIQNSNWEVYETNMAYWLSGSSWQYEPANSVEGDQAIITYTATSFCIVGGDPYTGVDAVQRANDTVKWKFTGNTIGNDVTLWTTSSTFTPHPCQVAGRC